jgi:hypothetical protein
VLRRVRFYINHPGLQESFKAYKGRGYVENRIEECKITLRWDKPSCHRFVANQARLLMGVLAYNLLQMLREF